MNEGIEINRMLVMAIIRKRNFTVREFAIKNGFCNVSLSKWINGSTKPKERNVVRLAKALGVPVDCLYTHGDFFNLWCRIQKLSAGNTEILFRQIAIFNRLLFPSS